MVVARPVLVRVLPGQDLAPAGTPMSWTGPIRGHRAMAPGRIRAPWRSPVAPAAIKPRGRAGSDALSGSLPLFPQLVIDPAQGCGRMGKADGAGEQDDGVVDFFRGRPGL